MRKVVQFSENQIGYSSRDDEMKLEPDKFYKVMKGNTDRSVLIGDVMYKRRKWSRIHKVKHRNKKAVNKEIK